MSEHGVRVIQMYAGTDEPAIGQCLCGRVFALNSGRSLTRAENPRTAGDLDIVSRWVLTGRYKDGTITVSPITLPDHFSTTADSHLHEGNVDMDRHHEWMKESHDALHEAKTPHGHGNGLPPDHKKDAAPSLTHRARPTPASPEEPRM